MMKSNGWVMVFECDDKEMCELWIPLRSVEFVWAEWSEDDEGYFIVLKHKNGTRYRDIATYEDADKVDVAIAMMLA